MNTSAIYEFFIVTPDKQLKDVRAFLDQAVPEIVPEARHDFFRLVPEGECVSELASGTKYETNKVSHSAHLVICLALRGTRHLCFDSHAAVKFFAQQVGNGRCSCV